jgi:hypothetical protein
MRFIFKKLITKVKPNINSVEVHPQLSNNRHPVDGVLVGAGSLWRIIIQCFHVWLENLGFQNREIYSTL